jgi:hypothetical protein
MNWVLFINLLTTDELDVGYIPLYLYINLELPVALAGISPVGSSEYYFAGAKIQASKRPSVQACKRPAQAAVQAEYLTYPDAVGKNSFNVRLKISKIHGDP